MMSSAPIRFSLVQLRQHPEAVMALVCALLVILGWYTLNLGWIGIALFILTVAYVVGGLESAREGMTTLIQEKELDVDLLMIVAALGAAGLGLWRREYDMIVDGAVLILIFAISGALEGYAMQHTERSIRGLMSLTVDTARLVRQGGGGKGTRFGAEYWRSRFGKAWGVGANRWSGCGRVQHPQSGFDYWGVDSC